MTAEWKVGRAEFQKAGDDDEPSLLVLSTNESFVWSITFLFVCVCEDSHRFNMKQNSTFFPVEDQMSDPGG